MRVACGDDAVEPHGLASAAVKAGDGVVRSTSVGGKYKRIMINGPNERVDGILDASQLLHNNGRLTLSNEG